MAYPSDKLESKLAHLMTSNNSYRERIKQYIYLSGDEKQPLDKMEHALQLIINSEDLFKKIGDLRRFKGKKLNEKLEEKVTKGELSAEEKVMILSVEQARFDAILVDEFDFDSMKKKTYSSIIDSIHSPLK